MSSSLYKNEAIALLAHVAGRVFRPVLLAALLCLAATSAAQAADVAYAYDELGRLTSVAYNCSTSIAYQYDAAGNRTSTTTAGGNNCLFGAVDRRILTRQASAVTFYPRTVDRRTHARPLTISATSVPAHGSVVIGSGRALTYTPANGFIGTDRFTFTVSDRQSHFATATATIVVVAKRSVAGSIN